jgi:predicted HicB family RNase H-like nuclease
MTEDNYENNYETVEVDLEHGLLFQLMLLAHKQDITLNQLVNKILREFVDDYEQKNGSLEKKQDTE